MTQQVGVATPVHSQQATPIAPPRSTEQLADDLAALFNQASLALMLSVGHRTGLFESMAGQPPASTTEIAERAGLQERYVRECLGALVTSKIVCYDSSTATFWLPETHAPLLTGATDNLAALMQWFAVLANVEDHIVDVFRNGGGVGYECFHRFHEVMAVDSGQNVVAALHDRILPLDPGLVAKLESGIRALDIGCGSGRAAVALAEAFPQSSFAGYDLCEDAIQSASDLATAKGLDNVVFEVRDVTKLGDVGRFDLVTAFDVIHDQREPQTVLEAVAEALNPGGLFLMQDIAASSYLEKNIDHPIATFLYTVSTMHCMTVSLAQGGAGLGTCWGEELAGEMLSLAGFKSVRVEKLPHDIQNNYYLCRTSVDGN